MEKFEFESAICTSVEQSKRLLGLGLKKETADVVWMKELAWDEVAHCTYDAETCMLRPIDYLEGESYRGYIPAWSLHRLIEMIPLDIWHTECENGPRLKHTFWFCKHAPSYNSVENIDFRAHPNLYDNIIDCIEWLINEGYFNQDYLEEKK